MWLANCLLFSSYGILCFDFKKVLLIGKFSVVVLILFADCMAISQLMVQCILYNKMTYSTHIVEHCILINRLILASIQYRLYKQVLVPIYPVIRPFIDIMKMEASENSAPFLLVYDIHRIR